MRVDAEIDEAADLVHADRDQPGDDPRAGFGIADQRAGAHVALVGGRQQVGLVLGLQLAVDLHAERARHVAEQPHRGLQVGQERLAGLASRGLAIRPDEGMQQHGDARGARIVAVLGQRLAVQGDIAGQFLEALPHQVGQDARAEFGRLAIGIGIADHGHPDRQLLAPRQRVDAGGERLARAVGQLQRLAGPQLADLVEPLEGQLAVAAEGFGREHEIVRVPARGDRDADPAARQVVDHRPFLGHAHRMMQRQHHAAGAQLDMARLARQRGGQHRGIRREPAEGVEMALGQPQRGEALLVREARRGEQQVVLAALVGGIVGAEKGQAEVRHARAGRLDRAAGGVRGRGRERRAGGCRLGPRGGRRRRLGRYGAAPARGRRQRRRVGEEAGRHQRARAGLETRVDRVHVRLAVRVGQVHGAAFPHVQPVGEQVIAEQVEVVQAVQAEQRAAVDHLHRQPMRGEQPVQARHQRVGAAVQAGLQLRAALDQAPQHGMGGGQRQRMLAEGAGEEGGVGARAGAGRGAAVDAVHVRRVARDDADRHAAAHRLAIGHQVGAHLEPGLRAAGMEAEAGDHLVEDQGDAQLAGERAQPLQELARLQLGPAALHRLDQHRRQFVRVLADHPQRMLRAVFEHQRLLAAAGLQARRRRHRVGVALGVGGHQHAVGPAVVRAGELGDLRAAVAGARQAHRQHHRLGAGIAEGHALHAGQLADHPRDLAGQRRLRPQVHAARQLRADRLAHEGRAMAEQRDAEAHRQVDVAVAVQVDQLRALRMLGHHRVEQLAQRHRQDRVLGREAEAGQRAVIGDHLAILARMRLRGRRAAREIGDEALQVGALRRGQRGIGIVAEARRGRRGSRSRSRSRLPRRGGGRRGQRARGRGRRGAAHQGQLRAHQVELLLDQPFERGGVGGRCGGGGYDRRAWRRRERRSGSGRGNRDGRGGLPRRVLHHLRPAPIRRHVPLQMRGQLRDAGQFLEQLADRHRHAEARLQLPHRLHQHQRIGAEFEQGRARVDARGIGAQQPRHQFAQLGLDALAARAGTRRHDGGRSLRRGFDTMRGGAGKRAVEGGGHGQGFRSGSGIDGNGGMRDSGRRFEPVAAAVEGISGQAHAARRRAAMQRGPIRLATGGPQPRQHAQAVARLGGAAGRGHQRERGQRRIGLLLPGKALQRAAGADLEQQGRVAQAFAQRGEPVGEAHRLAQMARPVAGIDGLFVANPVACQVRDEGQRRRAQRDARQRLAQRLAGRLHHRRMERVRDAQTATRHAARLERGQQRVDARALAGHHAARRAVYGGQRQALAQRFGQLGLAEPDAGHRAGRQGLHQAAAQRDDRQRVLQREHAGQAGGHVFAEAMSDHRGGPDAEPDQAARQRVVEREQRRLGQCRRFEPRGRRGVLSGIARLRREQQLAQVEAEMRGETVGTGIEGRAKPGQLAIQPARHADTLRALPREHEDRHRPRTRMRELLDQAGRIAGRQPAGDLLRVVGRRADQRAPMRQRAAAGLQAEGQLGRRGVALAQARGEPVGHPFQRLGRLRRPHQQRRHGRLAGRRRDRRGLVRSRLVGHLGRIGQHQVRERAAETKRTHAGETALRARPGTRRGGDLQARAVQRAMVVQALKMQLRGHALVAHRQHRLDQAGDAGGRFQVPHVGLDRTDHAGLGRRLAMREPMFDLRFGIEHLAQRVQLDRVAQRGAGAMRLDMADRGRRHAGLRQRAPDHGGLRQAVGRGQAVAAPVLLHGGAEDHGMHGVAVAARVGQALEHHHPATLAAHVAVGAVVEGLAAAVGRQHARFGEGLAGARGEDQVHAAGDRQRALAVAQAAAGGMHGHQRGRTGGVDRQARAAQVEQVGQAVGHHAEGAAGGVVERERLARAVADLVVVAARHADEHAGLAAGQRAGRDAGMLQRLPGHFEHQALLRVDVRGLDRRDAEQLAVEAVDLVEEAGDAREGGRAGAADRAEAAGRQARGRHFADRVDALVEQAPEGLGIVGAGQAAAEPDDRDRLVRLGRRARFMRRRGRRLGLAAQMQRQRERRRVIPEQGGLDRPAEPARQRLGGLHGEDRIDAVREETLGRVDRTRRQAQALLDARAQPFDDPRRGRRRRCRLVRPVRRERRAGRRGRIPGGGALALATREFRQRAALQVVAALAAADLAAGGARHAAGLEQHDHGRLHADPLEHGFGDRTEHRLLGLPTEIELLHHHQLLGALAFPGEGRGRVDAQAGVAGERGFLDVLRVDVAPADDDQVLDAPADEQLAVVQEAEIAGAHVGGAARVAFQARAECFRAGFRLAPVAGRDVLAGHPDLADAALGQLDAALGINDAQLARDRRAGGHQRLVRLVLVGAQQRTRAAPRGRHHQGGFRQAVAGQEGLAAEAAGGEGLGEAIERARAHRLGAAIGGHPARQVEPGALGLADALHAQVVGEVGRARMRDAIAADRVEPGERIAQERVGRHHHGMDAQVQHLQQAADQAHVVVRRQPGRADAVGVQRERGLDQLGVADQVAMGDHHALGRAGRP
ncbi:Uncharacterised protein [Burkholderia gladioli]|nr:Uncharacterised protein [Burkholderia gladioli]